LVLDRDQVATGFYIAFILSLTIFYGTLGEFISQDYIAQTSAFWIASATWLGLYLYCDGKDWAEATGAEKTLFAVSWGILILVTLEKGIIGSGDLSVITPYITDIQYSEWILIGIHTISAYFVWSDRPGGR
jgi:hypothetical protein